VLQRVAAFPVAEDALEAALLCRPAGAVSDCREQLIVEPVPALQAIEESDRRELDGLHVHGAVEDHDGDVVRVRLTLGVCAAVVVGHAVDRLHVLGQHGVERHPEDVRARRALHAVRGGQDDVGSDDRDRAQLEVAPPLVLHKQRAYVRVQLVVEPSIRDGAGGRDGKHQRAGEDDRDRDQPLSHGTLLGV
jgi:hypothetical protein